MKNIKRLATIYLPTFYFRSERYRAHVLVLNTWSLGKQVASEPNGRIVWLWFGLLKIITLIDAVEGMEQRDADFRRSVANFMGGTHA
jgi:hypothetical protein